jgi:hypothetical protein
MIFRVICAPRLYSPCLRRIRSRLAQPYVPLLPGSATASRDRSCCRWRRVLGLLPPAHGYRLQPETILPRPDHRQRRRRPSRQAGRVLQFQPRAQPRIVNLAVALPEFRFQPALDLQVIQLQLDRGHLLGKIPPDVGCTYVQAGYRRASVLNLDQHNGTHFQLRLRLQREKQTVERGVRPGKMPCPGPGSETCTQIEKCGKRSLPPQSNSPDC